MFDPFFYFNEFWKRVKTPDEWAKDPRYLRPGERPGRDPSFTNDLYEQEETVLGSVGPKLITEVYPVKAKDCCGQKKQPSGTPVTVPPIKGGPSPNPKPLDIYIFDPVPMGSP